MFIPAKPARAEANRGRELEPKPGDGEATLAWPFDAAQGEARMASDAGKQVYRERAATSETANADLRCHRGLTQFTVRGLKPLDVAQGEAKRVALWCATATSPARC